MKHVICVLAVFMIGSPARTQEVRYELGQRLRQFEIEFDQQTDAAARKRVVAGLNTATTSFLLGRLPDAARAIEECQFALRSTDVPSPAERWAASVMFVPDSRLIDITKVELGFTLKPLYRSPVVLPKGIKLKLVLRRSGTEAILSELTKDVDALPFTVRLPLKNIPEGDHSLTTQILDDKQVLTSSKLTLSVVADSAGRLIKIEKTLAMAGDDNRSVEAETARGLLKLLKGMLDGQTPETEYPAARLFAGAQSAANAAAAGKPYYLPERTGQFWLWLNVQNRAAPVRVQVPAGLKKEKLVPLVIALHGAGGSENMFFDAYGHGLIARLCAERGWLLVAVRGGKVDGVVEELARRYPVDTKRVFLVGHSMGAQQSVSLAGNQPEKYAAVAALAPPFGQPKPSEALKLVSFFVGVGKEDFTVPGALGLQRSLERAGVKHIVYKEYPDVEHLLVVQLGLSDVFKFFDERR